MIHTFTGSPAPSPEDMTFSARLAWHYFFHNGWAITQTQDRFYIVTDESCDLSIASIYPDDETLISWLEEVTTRQMEDDPVGYLRTFVDVPELANDAVAEVVRGMIDEEQTGAEEPLDVE